MRPLILAFAIAATAVVLGIGATSVVFADAGPHAGSFTYIREAGAFGGQAGRVTDRCASCHRTHTAIGGHLLKADSVQALCKTCHGPGSGVSVWDGGEYTSGAITGALKGGGMDLARIDANHATGGTNDAQGAAILNTDAGVAVLSAHVKMADNGLTPQNVIWGNTNGGSTDPGKALTTALSCADCHNPHGGAGTNGAATYRILRPVPNQSGAAGVELPDESASSHEYLTANYWLTYEMSGGGFVDTTVPWQPAQMSSWCTTCHSRYLADGAAATTSSGSSVFTFRHQSDASETKTVPSTSGSAGDNPYKGKTFSPFCLQCHVAHGSNAALTSTSGSQAIPWPGADPTTGKRLNESTLLKVDNRGTCILCHGQYGVDFVE